MNAATTPPVFAWPVCGVTLPPAMGSYLCANGHRFDAGHYAPLADGVAERMRAVLSAGPDRVAGTHRMPVIPGRVDVLLSHFSPVSVDADARTRLAALNALDTEVEVIVHTYRRTEIAPAVTD